MDRVDGVCTRMVCGMECNVSVPWRAKTHEMTPFLPDFLVPLANLLFKIMSDPQRLRLNSLLGRGFMLIAADASSACWTKKKPLFFNREDMKFILWAISHFKNEAPVEPEETLATNV